MIPMHCFDHPPYKKMLWRCNCSDEEGAHSEPEGRPQLLPCSSPAQQGAATGVSDSRATPRKITVQTGRLSFPRSLHQSFFFRFALVSLSQLMRPSRPLGQRRSHHSVRAYAQAEQGKQSVVSSQISVVSSTKNHVRPPNLTFFKTTTRSSFFLCLRALLPPHQKHGLGFAQTVRLPRPCGCSLRFHNTCSRCACSWPQPQTTDDPTTGREPMSFGLTSVLAEHPEERSHDICF